MQYDHGVVPADGERISRDASLNVPDRPIVPYIEGDGIGVDVTPVMLEVVNAAVRKACGDRRRIAWMEIYAGDKALEVYGPGAYCPDETLHAPKDFVVSIKGPLATPIGGGIRFPESSGLGIKPVSKQGSQRLVRKALQYAVDDDRVSVTLVHEGNIMKCTEGAFRNWGCQLAKDEFGAKELNGGPWMSFRNPRNGHEIVVKDAIAAKELTYDLARLREAIRVPKRELAAQRHVEEAMQRLIPGAKRVGTKGFGEAVSRHVDDRAP